MFICFTSEAKADEARQDWDCINDSAIMSMQGGHLSMMSRVESLERCYFVLTQENSGEQCCYNLDGFSDDCEKSEDYKRRNNTKCAKENVEIKLDSEVSGTCNLTIKSVSENSAGRYKSYEADHTGLAQEFCVIVSGQIEEGVSVAVLLTVAILLTLALALAVPVVFLRRNIRAKDGYMTLFDKYEIHYRDGLRWKNIERATESPLDDI